MIRTLCIALALLLSGCAVTDRAATGLALGTNLYCMQPYAVRFLIREGANDRMDGGNKVMIICGGGTW